MFILGFVLIFLVGGFLGALGAGGAIFSIPILMSCFSLNDDDAIGVSFFVSGITALLALIKYYKEIKWYPYTYFFIIPATSMTWLARRIIIPYVEAYGHADILKMNLMITLSILMFFSAYGMAKYTEINTHPKNHFFLTIILAIFYGTLVGGVGSGGGFLLIPTFRLLMGMHMKQAVATSLSIMALTMLFGFEANAHFIDHVSWELISLLTGTSIAGMFIGQKLHDFCSQPLLQLIFMTALIFTATAILIQQFC